MATTVKVIHEVSKVYSSGVRLCYQFCKYIHDNGQVEDGYRWMYRNQQGKLLAHRGQARLLNMQVQLELIGKSIAEGWGNKQCS